MGRIGRDNMEDLGYKLLASGIQLSDPKLYDALNSLNSNIVELNRKLDNMLAVISSIQDFVGMPH